MISEANIKDDKRLELIQVAIAMIDGTMNLVAGARRICSLRYELGDPDNDVFMTIRGFESETDDLPLGREREGYAKDYLNHLDEEAQRYIAEAKDAVIDACREIIRVFSSHEER